MNTKNIIPLFLAHQLGEYESKYNLLFIRGFTIEIKNNLLKRDYYWGELEVIYYDAINKKNKEIIQFMDETLSFNKMKKFIIYEAAKMNFPQIVQNYLNVTKPSKKSKFLFLLLEISTLHSSFEIVDLLLQYGVDFKKKDYSCIRTVLENGNFKMFKLFHKYKLDINKSEYLFLSIEKDNLEWFNYLLNNGFEISSKNEELIYNFMSFSGALNILESEKNNFIDKKELMLNACCYTPTSKQYLEKLYKKVDFYNTLKKKLILKEKEAATPKIRNKI